MNEALALQTVIAVCSLGVAILAHIPLKTAHRRARKSRSTMAR